MAQLGVSVLVSLKLLYQILGMWVISTSDQSIDADQIRCVYHQHEQ